MFTSRPDIDSQPQQSQYESLPINNANNVDSSSDNDSEHDGGEMCICPGRRYINHASHCGLTCSFVIAASALAGTIVAFAISAPLPVTITLASVTAVSIVGMGISFFGGTKPTYVDTKDAVTKLLLGNKP